jgi:hypothetical protein
VGVALRMLLKLVPEIGLFVISESSGVLGSGEN